MGVVIVAGTNDLGHISKAQLCARSEDMITDVWGVWDKACPNPQIQVGLFISLVHPHMWYDRYTDQWWGRDACRSLNSHMEKTYI